MADDRIIGRKEIVQFLRPLIGCTSWNAVRNQRKRNGLPYDHTANGKPFILPKEILEWDRKKRQKAVEKARGDQQCQNS